MNVTSRYDSREISTPIRFHVPEPPGRDPEQPPEIPPPTPPDEDIDLPPREDPAPMHDPEEPIRPR